MKLLFLTGILSLTTLVFSETKQTTIQYVEQWKSVAIEQMKTHKIPASITLAQGILESANGNSRLAKIANNHFGIKCHKVWRGATFIQDDDTRNECFRSYNSAKESYNDHSLFLTTRGRYSGLFLLRLTDYKRWAKGLKSAGYATNPKYAYLLIDIIERYHLNQYDNVNNNEYRDVSRSAPKTKVIPIKKEKKNTIVKKRTVKKKTQVKADKKSTYSNSNFIEINELNHDVTISLNKVKYIVVKGGDTYCRIAKEFELTINQLYKYNEFSKKDVLSIGDRIYITPKKNRAHRSRANYVCSKTITLREVAHQEGVKLSSLMKLNLIDNPDKIMQSSTKLTLR